MQKLRSYVLPIAIVLGLLLHRWCALFSGAVPYIIFSILLLTFSAVDLKKLRPQPMFAWIALFQVAVSFCGYWLLTLLGASPIVAEGVLVGVICPVASSVAVISCMMGANRQTVTSYTVLGNLLVVVVAPIYFTIVGVHPEFGFAASLFVIMRRIGVVIGLPFVVALLLQLLAPKVNQALGRINGLSFYLWCFALLFTLGQTFDFIFIHGPGNWASIAWLGVASLLFCIVQFGLGKLIGRHYGDTISGGQLLGQKNTAMGIWMANTFLHPLASVFLAFYAVFQNLFNSWQLWRYDRKEARR